MYLWPTWKHLVRRWAHRHGLLDPIALLARLERFGQASEVKVPLELLRAGAVFHARGLANSRVIQNNLDWVWPFWVQRQFDPHDPAFMPRGFALTHINLTHRNWTAVGLPDCNALPIIDPAGMVTPFLNGWSIDAWLKDDDGKELIPSRLAMVQQELRLTEERLSVVSRAENEGMLLVGETYVDNLAAPVCRLHYRAESPTPAWLVVSLRPCNPEGISFLPLIKLSDENHTWRLEGGVALELTAPDKHLTGTYDEGDVYLRIPQGVPSRQVKCEAGLATAAALYRVVPGQPVEVRLQIPLEQDIESRPLLPHGRATSWPKALETVCHLEIPDKRWQFLYNAAIHSLVLHSPGDIYPGPSTYKRFWFRDAAIIAHAMLCAGLTNRTRQTLDKFPARQRMDGYFHSQDGEWDSNGQVLWIYHRYCELTGHPPPDEWCDAVRKGGRWIHRKRQAANDSPHAGLLPAGFSAEHLGNNDYYYWDDFWAVAGLRGAATLCGNGNDREHFQHEADDLMNSIANSLQRTPAAATDCKAMPASPYRRMDAGAVGSLVAGYPLQLFAPDDPRLLATAEYLMQSCLVQGAFFHQVVHAGINAYLTLHLAQVLLRAGDSRFLSLMQAVAELATPTGQWPEAINPRTGGGCMGDGQHIWAAAEWIMMMRALFVQEENDVLVVCAGIPRAWLHPGTTLKFGPTPTRFGRFELTVACTQTSIEVAWRGVWHNSPPNLEIRMAGCPLRKVNSKLGSISIQCS